MLSGVPACASNASGLTCSVDLSPCAKSCDDTLFSVGNCAASVFNYDCTCSALDCADTELHVNNSATSSLKEGLPLGLRACSAHYGLLYTVESVAFAGYILFVALSTLYMLSLNVHADAACGVVTRTLAKAPCIKVCGWAASGSRSGQGKGGAIRYRGAPLSAAFPAEEDDKSSTGRHRRGLGAAFTSLRFALGAAVCPRSTTSTGEGDGGSAPTDGLLGPRAAPEFGGSGLLREPPPPLHVHGDSSSQSLDSGHGTGTTSTLFFFALCQVVVFCCSLGATVLLVLQGRFCSGADADGTGTRVPVVGGLVLPSQALILREVPGCAFGSTWANYDIEGGVLRDANVSLLAQVAAMVLLLGDGVLAALWACTGACLVADGAPPLPKPQGGCCSRLSPLFDSTTIYSPRAWAACCACGPTRRRVFLCPGRRRALLAATPCCAVVVGGPGGEPEWAGEGWA